MLTVLMAFAACYGVLQLAVLGSGTRSVRVLTLLLAVGAGFYGCGMTAVLLQLAYTRTLSALAGERLYGVVNVAAYTIDPLIEEIVKVIPLLIIGMWARLRRAWRLTDYLLLGAAFGAGFGLLEAVFRMSAHAGKAIDTLNGYLIPRGFSNVLVPDVGTTLASWLPAPTTYQSLGIPDAPDVSFHLTWSALAGLGIGLLLRGRGLARLAAPMFLVLVWADHAALNFDVSLSKDSTLGTVLSSPFVAAQPVRGLWPLLALGLAVWSDARVLRAGKAAHRRLLLPGEQPTGLSGLVVLSRYGMLRPPWTTWMILRYALLRRTALFTGARGEILALAAQTRDHLTQAQDRQARTGTAQGWRAVGIPGPARPGKSAWLKRYWPLLVWAILTIPPLIYFLLGTTPGIAGIQRVLGWTILRPLLIVLFLAGMALITWHIIAGLRVLPGALRGADPEMAARIQFRIAAGAGALVLGTVSLTAFAAGTRLDQRVISNVHVLDAIDDLLLYGGIALLLAALVFFPPVGAVTLAGGGMVLVPTITTGFLTLGALGTAGILLSEANPPSGSQPSSGGGPSSSSSGLSGSVKARLGDYFQGGARPKASELEEFAKAQGWTRTQTPNGPPKYVDENGIVRLTIKQGSPRTPGSETPHVEVRNARGQRTDPFGNPVTRTSPDNHTPIEWDLQ
ncbi:PrsW family glutamic-type intramembrane protease [Nonomuraea sp. 3N208]|uniref:PrsW family glutamic-type intramembrane protease n=1 Tax=Nonomuraea sp. 3N208 TaxID=3457421 RepID=UPI003FD1AE65